MPEDFLRNLDFIRLLRRGEGLEFLQHFRQLNSNQKRSVLTLALKFRAVMIVELILKEEDVNVNGNDGQEKPLHIAAKFGYTRICRIMIYEKEAEVDPVDEEGNTPLFYAIYERHLDIARLLICRGASLHVMNREGMLPLHYAVIRGYAFLQLLLSHGSNVNATCAADRGLSRDGFTPLHVAVALGKMAEAEILLQWGASLDIPSLDGNTPLLLAVMKNNTQIVAQLLQRRPSFSSLHHRRALHIAVSNDNLDIAKKLLDAGANVNEIFSSRAYPQEMRGRAPLHVAVKLQLLDMAKLLIERGANVNLIDQKEKPTLYYAMKNGDLAMVDLLTESGFTEYHHESLVEVAMPCSYMPCAQKVLALRDNAANETVEQVASQVAALELDEEA